MRISEASKARRNQPKSVGLTYGGPSYLGGFFCALLTRPSLQVRWDAAGYEFDRYERELGSPDETLLLASSIGFQTQYAFPMIDEQLWFTPGRDGAGVHAPQQDGEPHRFVRADMTYTEYPNGGPVFATGSICWRGELSWNGYDNSVPQVTENVLRRFSEDTRESQRDPKRDG